MATVWLDFGSGFEDISSYVKSYSIKYGLMNKLKSNRDIGSIIIANDDTIRNKILSADEIKVEIYESGSLVFKGYVRENYKWNFKNITKGNIGLEIEDNGKLLEKKTDSTGVYENYYIVNNTNKSTSLLHQLLYSAGYSDSDINLSDILTQIDYFYYDKDVKYKDLINKILFEFGYVYYWDKEGKITEYKFLQNSFTASITLTEFREKIEVVKNKEEYNQIKLIWLETEEESDVIVASDTTGGTADQKANITVNADEYYPVGSDTKDTYIEYKTNNSKKLIIAKNVSLDLSYSGTITTEVFTNYFKRAKIRLKNTGGSTATITKLDVVGTAVWEKQKNIAIAGTGDKVLKLETEYIRSSTQASDLANYLLNYYQYSDFTYTFKSDTELEIGDIVELNESFTGINTKVRIIKKTRTYKRGYTDTTYLAIGVTDYTIGSITEEQIINSDPIPETTDIIVEDTPTYEEIIETGFDVGNGTTTPEKPVWLTSEVNYRTIHLTWEKQWNLTNLDYYEIQVSENGTDWYSFDGTLDGTTKVYQESISYIGAFTSDTPPEGKTYYFRVRQVTKTNDTSDWSDLVSKSTNPLGGNQDDIIFYDQYNYWDLANNKWRVGGVNKYIYFDGTDIYFKSVDIELTTADLITYNSGKTIRFRHTGLGLYWEGGTGYGDEYGKIELMDDNKYLNINGGIRLANNFYSSGLDKGFIASKDFMYMSSGMYYDGNDWKYLGGDYPVVLDIRKNGGIAVRSADGSGLSEGDTISSLFNLIDISGTGEVVLNDYMNGTDPRLHIKSYSKSVVLRLERINTATEIVDFGVDEAKGLTVYVGGYSSGYDLKLTKQGLDLTRQLNCYKHLNNLLLKSVSGNSSITFYLKKPIMAMITSAYVNLYFYSGSSWILIMTGSGTDDYLTNRQKPLNPGYYKLEATTSSSVNLTAAGVYGASGTVVASDIVS